jgi:hypothetical protein
MCLDSLNLKTSKKDKSGRHLQRNKPHRLSLLNRLNNKAKALARVLLHQQKAQLTANLTKTISSSNLGAMVR